MSGQLGPLDMQFLAQIKQKWDTFTCGITGHMCGKQFIILFTNGTTYSKP